MANAAMNHRQRWKVIPFLLALVTTCLAAQTAQVIAVSEKNAVHPGASTVTTREQTAAPALKDNSRTPTQAGNKQDGAIRKAIIIGFVGGFVKHDDARHPEVQFAAYLRDRYPFAHAEVFSNHNGQKAFREVLRLLDANHSEAPTAAEKDQAAIIIYGHSWGASETVWLARKLEQNNIPVLLTIQVDIVAKPGQSGSTIPPNVAQAVNFYQSKGPIHGRSEIFAADPARTRILGNIQMKYDGHPINCDNYPWFPRVLNRPHHEIENDPRVWDQAASLIDSDLSDGESKAKPSSPSQSPFFSFLHDRP